MVLLTSPIGKPRQIVDPLVLLRNSTQKSLVSKIRLVTIGFRSNNTEVQYRLYRASRYAQVLESRAKEPFTYVLGCPIRWQ